MQWTTQAEHIDAETGEILTPKQVKKGNYILIATQKLKTIYGTTHSIKKIRRTYRRNNQTELEFGTTGRNYTNGGHTV